MALTATVTKISVTSSDKDIFQITLHLNLNDGAVDVLDKDFVQPYRKGNNFDTIAVVQEKFRIAMQQTIDFYKDADQISNSAALATAITSLETSLVE